MFQHVKTNYDDVEVKRKRVHMIPANETLNATMLNLTTESHLVVTPEGNFTRLIEEYTEMVEWRGLKYGNGINVLGKSLTLCMLGNFFKYLFLSQFSKKFIVSTHFFC